MYNTNKKKKKMASPPSSNNNHNSSSSSFQPVYPTGFDPNSIPNTTFVQADPTTFRAVVQKLTGAVKPNSGGEMGPRKPAFKLHERRPTARKLEIKLNNNVQHSPCHRTVNLVRENTVMISPVSPLDHQYYYLRTPMEEEERAIADKGFYLHPSPLSTPRGSDPPELLPLFPLTSPRED